MICYFSSAALLSVDGGVTASPADLDVELLITAGAPRAVWERYLQ